MDHKYLALKIFSLPKVKGSDIGGGGSNITELNWSDVLFSILFKFIDVIEGVVIIVIGLFVMKMAKKYFDKIEVQHERQRTALNLLEKITSGFIIVISFTLGLRVMGLDLTLIVSVILLGVSFGLRDVIKNYVAGLQILFKAPFEIGDVIKIRTYIGKIEKIEFQATTLRTFDNKTVTIHNSDMLKQSLTNFSRAQQTRLEVTIPVDADVNFVEVVQKFEKVLEANAAVLKTPRYSIVLKNFVAKSAQMVVRFWVQRPCNELHIRSELALALKHALKKDSGEQGSTAPGELKLAPVEIPAEQYADIDEPGV